jgi:2,4-dienoyl-CoA reductase-like NADH-dependent reductase (Old Yellow Enzyme family)
VDQSLADIVAVGRPFIANPDLVRRWQNEVPLSEDDPATYYGGDARGYTDHSAALAQQ